MELQHAVLQSSKGWTLELRQQITAALPSQLRLHVTPVTHAHSVLHVSSRHQHD